MSPPFSRRSGTSLERSRMTGKPDRRTVLGGGLALAATAPLRPAQAETEDMDKAIRAFTGGPEPKSGKVAIDIAPLVENGNAVAVEVAVDHPMLGGNPVTEIAVFNEKNPQADVALFHLTPRAGRAHVVTRIRLATTQHIAAVARLSDGTCWIDKREVIVTIAACTEE